MKKNINEVKYYDIYHEYEYKDWTIYICGFIDEDLDCCAIKTKYKNLFGVSYLLSEPDRYMISENLEETLKLNGFNIIDELNDNGDSESIIENTNENIESLYYIMDRDCVNIADVNYKSVASLLYKIIDELDYMSDEHHYILQQITDYPELVFNKKKSKIVILKEKKEKVKKISKNKRGFMHNAWAAMVKERDKKCIRCGSEDNLHAHHIISYRNNIELRYDINNGETLCSYCHRKHHKENGRV